MTQSEPAAIKLAIMQQSKRRSTGLRDNGFRAIFRDDARRNNTSAWA